jgi:Coenzyme PQQ synthesis protein D (PqqD)
MQLDSRPMPRDGVLVQEMAGTRLLLDPETGKYFTLDEVGSRIWALCDGRAASAIADELCAEYDAPAAQIRDDVLELLGELASERLVLECS